MIHPLVQHQRMHMLAPGRVQTVLPGLLVNVAMRRLFVPADEQDLRRIEFESSQRPCVPTQGFPSEPNAMAYRLCQEPRQHHVGQNKIKIGKIKNVIREKESGKAEGDKSKKKQGQRLTRREIGWRGVRLVGAVRKHVKKGRMKRLDNGGNGRGQLGQQEKDRRSRLPLGKEVASPCGRVLCRLIWFEHGSVDMSLQTSLRGRHIMEVTLFVIGSLVSMVLFAVLASASARKLWRTTSVMVAFHRKRFPTGRYISNEDDTECSATKDFSCTCVSDTPEVV